MVFIYMETINNMTKEKRWILKSKEDEKSLYEANRIAKNLNIHPIVARLLYNRGYTDEQACKMFICMESEMLCNPFDLKDVDVGIERIHRAIKNKEKITVYGDYDVDGVTAVCTLYLYLQSFGADVNYYIPNRVGEGYGVSEAAIECLKNQGTTLIITVDTGITADKEVVYAKGIGVDFVITDHHECRSEIPDAVAVINPHRPDCNYPFKELAGVGVVFKLISAYEEKYSKCSKKEAVARIFSHYADLVAIGTIADVMPIKGENRIIVSYGLNMIEKNPRPGLMALIEASASRNDNVKSDRRKKNTKVTSGYIGYTLAPRINAAGRIRSASIAVELFLTMDKNNALEIAEELCLANKERQAEENKIMKEAYSKIEELDIENNPVIVLDADNWHHGVIGIVASRITEKYSRPSILVSFEGNEDGSVSEYDIGKGSGRSIKGLNLVDALCHCSDQLVKFGGHELAAGLSVERGKLQAFREKINSYAKENLKEENMIPTLEADAEINFKDINFTLAQQLQQLEPYGVGNPMPTFIMRGVRILELSPVSDGKHTRLMLSDGSFSTAAMFFSNSPDSLGITQGDLIDVLFNIDINEWLGRKSVQIIVKDIRLSDSNISEMSKEKNRFKEIWSGASYYPSENILPIRDDFVKVYQFLQISCKKGNTKYSLSNLCSRLIKIFDNDASKIGYVKLKYIIMVLNELNILTVEETEEDVYSFKINVARNTSIEKSNILRKLRSQQKQI